MIYQLVNGNVKVYSLRRGLSQLEIIDHDTIKKEYNLDPHDFIDLKALAGDPSDNIPGVPGVGPKTATELIQKFDTLEKLYEKIQETMIKIQKNHKSQITNHKQITNSKSEILNNLTIEQFNNEMVENVAKELEIKPRTIKLLLENKDQAFLSQKLATIHCDVPIDFNLEDAKWGDYDKDKLRGLFEELGFRSLLARFGKVEAKSDRKPTEEQKKKDEQLKLL
ncbi:MAG: DNA polymerase I [bacterium ADurb.BinA186]|nr:MAG: DNA polymerase I [bacterium ADurb.BinA186]